MFGHTSHWNVTSYVSNPNEYMSDVIIGCKQTTLSVNNSGAMYPGVINCINEDDLDDIVWSKNNL